MPQQPLKWKKYLKLVEYNLTTLKELEKQICRFSINHIDDFFCTLKDEILRQRADSCKNMFVIKLVKNESFYKLPNFRVHDINEFNDVYNRLTKDYKKNFDEIWYCKTLIDDSVFSAAGRFCICETSRYLAQIVEQLWNRSPRLIETMSDNDDFAFVRAERIEWARRYNILELHPSEALSIDKITDQFNYSMLELEKLREKLEIFINYLRSFGLEIISIEYKIINGELFIIDWDTSNDLLVLR